MVHVHVESEMLIYLMYNVLHNVVHVDLLDLDLDLHVESRFRGIDYS